MSSSKRDMQDQTKQDKKSKKQNRQNQQNQQHKKQNKKRKAIEVELDINDREEDGEDTRPVKKPKTDKASAVSESHSTTSRDGSTQSRTAQNRALVAKVLAKPASNETPKEKYIEKGRDGYRWFGGDSAFLPLSTLSLYRGDPSSYHASQSSTSDQEVLTPKQGSPSTQNPQTQPLSGGPSNTPPLAIEGTNLTTGVSGAFKTLTTNTAHASSTSSSSNSSSSSSSSSASSARTESQVQRQSGRPLPSSRTSMELEALSPNVLLGSPLTRTGTVVIPRSLNQGAKSSLKTTDTTSAEDQYARALGMARHDSGDLSPRSPVFPSASPPATSLSFAGIGLSLAGKGGNNVQEESSTTQTSSTSSSSSSSSAQEEDAQGSTLPNRNPQFPPKSGQKKGTESATGKTGYRTGNKSSSRRPIDDDEEMEVAKLVQKSLARKARRAKRTAAPRIKLHDTQRHQKPVAEGRDNRLDGKPMFPHIKKLESAYRETASSTKGLGSSSLTNTGNLHNTTTSSSLSSSHNSSSSSSSISAASSRTTLPESPGPESFAPRMNSPEPNRSLTISPVTAFEAYQSPSKKFVSGTTTSAKTSTTARVSTQPAPEPSFEDLCTPPDAQHSASQSSFSSASQPASNLSPESHTQEQLTADTDNAMIVSDPSPSDLLTPPDAQLALSQPTSVAAPDLQNRERFAVERKQDAFVSATSSSASSRTSGFVASGPAFLPLSSRRVNTSAFPVHSGSAFLPLSNASMANSLNTKPVRPQVPPLSTRFTPRTPPGQQ